jgi:hypothetical protein
MGGIITKQSEFGGVVGQTWPTGRALYQSELDLYMNSGNYKSYNPALEELGDNEEEAFMVYGPPVVYYKGPISAGKKELFSRLNRLKAKLVNKLGASIPGAADAINDVIAIVSTLGASAARDYIMNSYKEDVNKQGIYLNILDSVQRVMHGGYEGAGETQEQGSGEAYHHVARKLQQ